MKKKEVTTVKVSKETLLHLNKLKIHPRQSYEEVIVELLKRSNSGESENK